MVPKSYIDCGNGKILKETTVDHPEFEKDTLTLIIKKILIDFIFLQIASNRRKLIFFYWRINQTLYY